MKKNALIYSLLFICISFPFLSFSQQYTQVRKIVPSDRKEDDTFGSSISISGNYVLIGAHFEDASEKIYDAGCAYIYKKNAAGIWEQKQKLVSSDRRVGGWFGCSVSISGNYAIIGQPRDDQGMIFIFERDTLTDTWSEKFKFYGTGKYTADDVGRSVSISGNTAFASAEYDTISNSNAARVFVFERSASGIWSRTQIITPPSNMKTWPKVAVDGRLGVIRTALQARYYYKEDSGIWTEKQYMKIIDPDSTSSYGPEEIGLHGNQLVLGLPSSDVKGKAYIYELDATTNQWQLKQKIVASDALYKDAFGRAISLYGNQLLIGARIKSVSPTTLYDFFGAAYLFKKDASGNWIEVQKFLPDDRDKSDAFGAGVAVSENDVFVGSKTSTDASGNNYLMEGGAVYLFANCSNCAQLISQPQNASTCISNPATFSVTASGTGNTYQWQVKTVNGSFKDIVDDTLYTGGTSSTLKISSSGLHLHGTQFKCIIRNPYSQRFSNIVTLTIRTQIISHSGNVDGCIDAPVAFNLVTKDSTTNFFQWQVNAGAGFSDITDLTVYEGFKTQHLLIKKASAFMNQYQYRCIVNFDSCGQTSNPGILTLNRPPVVAVNSAAICTGNMATLTAAGTPGYYWRNNGAITNAISVSPSATTTYTVIGTTACGLKDSAFSTVTVNPNPVVTISGNSTICIGDTARITLGGADSYLWSDNYAHTPRIFIPTTNTTYTVTGTFKATGCKSQSLLKLIVNKLPVIGSIAEPYTIICKGYPVTLHGTGAKTYQWTGGITDKVAFTPAATASYTLTAIDTNGCKNKLSTTITVSPEQALQPDSLRFLAGDVSYRPVVEEIIRYEAIAAHATHYRYSLDSASIAGGITINDVNGYVFFKDTWKSNSVITTTAYGCVSSIQKKHTVYSSTVPVITSFSPLSGPVGTTVTIYGHHFSKTASDNQVYFGATKATIISADTNQLQVIVPGGNTYVNISVSVNTLLAYSAQPFITTFPCGGILTDSSFSPPVLSNLLSTVVLKMAVGDWDNDGKPDLACIERQGGTPSEFFIYKNTSTPDSISFDRTVTSLETGANDIASADINGDGKLDIVSYGSPFIVYKNVSTPGKIAFQLIKFDYMYFGETIHIADMDGDGRPDLVYLYKNSNDRNIIIYRNTSSNGNISFANSHALFMTVDRTSLLKITDIDGDNKPDLVTGDNLKSAVYLYRNTSAGYGKFSFAPKISYYLDAVARDIVTGDVDNDGKTDLILPISQFKILILRNMSSPGSISHKKSDIIATTDYPSKLFVNDVDGDGKLDLISNSWHLYKNTSSSSGISFTELTYNKLYGPFVSCADFSGDQKPDIVFINDRETYSLLGVQLNKIKRGLSNAITSKADICGPGSATLTATDGTGNQTYRWYDALINGNLVKDKSSEFKTPVVSSTTTYYVTKYDSVAFCESAIRVPATVSVISIPATPSISQKSPNLLTSSSNVDNQWYKDGVAIPGATASDYTVTAPGTYTVVVKTNSCSSAPSAPVKIMVTDVSENNHQHLFTVYPNPSTGLITVLFQAAIQEQYQLEIKNTLGQTVYREQLSNKSGMISKELNLQAFGTGIYLITLQTGYSHSIRKVIIH